MYERNLSALCFGNTKTAALYFDRVVPIFLSLTFKSKDGCMVCGVPDEVDIDALTRLIYGRAVPQYMILKYLEDHWSPLMDGLGKMIRRKSGPPNQEEYEKLKQLYLSNAKRAGNTSVRGLFQGFTRGLGIEAYSVLLQPAPAAATFSEAYSCLSASNLRLIDTSKATWDQIMELRSDPKSTRRLRRLRLFFLENYVGKSVSFIEDDLLQRLDEYEIARKKHGFNAVVSSLSVILDATTLQAAAVAGVATALFGGPIAGITAGATVELGKVLLEVTKKVTDIRDLSDGHELGYIIRAKDKLS